MASTQGAKLAVVTTDGAGAGAGAGTGAAGGGAGEAGAVGAAGAGATGAGTTGEPGAAGTVSIPPAEATGMCIERVSWAISASLRGSIRKRPLSTPKRPLSKFICPRNANACVASTLLLSAPPHAEMAAKASKETHPPMRDILTEGIFIRAEQWLSR